MSGQEKDLLQKLQDKLLKLVMIAHSHMLTEEDELVYMPAIQGGVSLVQFDDALLIKLVDLSASDSGGTYFLKFEALGSLANALQAGGLATVFDAWLINAKFKRIFVIDEHCDLEKIFWQVVTKPAQAQTPPTVDQLMLAHESLDKLLVFYVMKFSNS